QVLAEIDVTVFDQLVVEQLTVEDVNAHRGQVGPAGGLDVELREQRRVSFYAGQRIARGFFAEAHDLAVPVDLQDTQPGRCGGLDGQDRDAHIGSGPAMVGQEVLK